MLKVRVQRGYHDVVVALHAIPAYVRQTHPPLQDLKHLGPGGRQSRTSEEGAQERGDSEKCGVEREERQELTHRGAEGACS